MPLSFTSMGTKVVPILKIVEVSRMTGALLIGRADGVVIPGSLAAGKLHDLKLSN